MRAKLTPWFDAATQPARDGQYEVQTRKGQFVALFKAGAWYEVHQDDNLGREEPVGDVVRWRGLLAEDQEEAGPGDAKPGVGQELTGGVEGGRPPGTSLH